jgi:hypothetical protein
LTAVSVSVHDRKVAPTSAASAGRAGWNRMR